MRLWSKWMMGQKSELETYVEFLPLPSFVITNGKISHLNEMALSLFGAESESQLYKTDFLNFFSDDSAYQIKDTLLNPVQLNSSIWTVTASMTNLKNEVRTVEMKANNLHFKGEQAFLVIMQDRSRQHQIEQELTDKSHLIEKIAQTIPDIIYVTDIRTNESIFENINLFHFLGFNEKEIESNKWTFLFSRVHPDDLPAIRHSAKQLQQSNDDVHFVETEYRLLDSDNNWRWIYSRSRVFKRAEDGTPLQHFGIAHDITALKKTQERLDEKLNELKSKNEVLEKYITSNRELEKYAYIASHDLKEPLRTIIGFTQLLEKKYRDNIDEEAYEYIDHIIEGTKRMEVLVKGLLMYSRVESDGMPFEETDLNEIMEQIIRDLNDSIQKTDVKIVYKGLPTIRCDKLQIRQLFQNLISNSIKFKGEAPLEIILSSEQKEDEIIFTFTDNGIGLDMAYKDKIFDIFSRLHTKDKYPGAGIGLSICKRIAERHNGRIWLDSEIGKGTSFYFAIPGTKLS